MADSLGAPENNKVLVTTPGTAVQFKSESTKLAALLIEAPAGNTGNVYVGASGVDSTNTPPLEPGDHMQIGFAQTAKQSGGDLYDWYVDAAVAGEGITYLGVGL